ncbi:non-specific phospholipase C2-like [Hordeum vulgare subsp. vulgare]|uniref:Non-specific phospholipase C2 n=1 Tax=Hordeum vulgare subsp. vulgare TaxID=112509 RepID=A0A8I6XUE4_HORVV|nr:non-specific phospholipase C2-like [Hordeum vulgare subsp. vulgare]
MAVPTPQRRLPACAATLLLALALSSSGAVANYAGPIKTVVVVVMENRSFDHMLGWMKRLNPAIDGVTGAEWNPANASDPSSGRRVYFGDGAQFVDPDPGHSYQEIRQQIFGSDDASGPPRMNGFVQQAASIGGGNMTDAVMNGFAPDSVAVYRELVSQFAVCDRWFASVPSSTQPNRLFVHSGTSGGATSNNPELLARGYPQRTIFDNVHDAGLSFGVYFQDVPAVLFYRNLRKLKYILNFHPFHNAFRDHARRGSLPNYAVIEQHYMDSKDHPANDDHPSHDVYQGQMFVKEIYETLRASPQWNETLMVLTYDEHGGFFDHVPTPVDGVPSPDDIVGPPPYNFTFNRLGVRVPAILISPWIEKGTVVHGPNGNPTSTSQFEHSSIPATVKKLFNLPQDFLTKRDAWAGTFEGVVQTRTEPRTDCPEQLPMPTRIRQTEANEEAKLSSFQQEIVQLAAVLNGDHQLSSLQERIRERMNVREGTSYMRSAVRRFFEAGMSAKRMGLADDEQIVKMRPSLTTRITSSPADQDDSP